MNSSLGSLPAAAIALPLVLCAGSSAEAAVVPVIWDNSSSNGQWSAPENWSGDLEPDLSSGAVFPASLAGTVTLTAGEQAQSLEFAGNYTLSGGNLALNTSAEITVAEGSTADIASVLSSADALRKKGLGTLRLSNSGNHFAGYFIAQKGLTELAAPAGNAVSSTKGLSVSGDFFDPGVTLRLAGNEQIADSTPTAIVGDDAILDLNNFTETLSSLNVTQPNYEDFAALRTGANGKLVITGNLQLRIYDDTTNPAEINPRGAVITGTGTKALPAYDGTLDLGGGIRPVLVDNVPNSLVVHGTIETQIANGGLSKTGVGTLHLTHPQNSFAGGIRITQGLVQPRKGGSLGTGPVNLAYISTTFPSGIDFRDLGGETVPNNFVIESTFGIPMSFALPAPETVTLSGTVTLQRDLNIDVTHGSTDPARCAVADFTGNITDGPASFGLIKTGDGLLRLHSGNAFAVPPEIRRGILQVSEANGLGAPNGSVRINGGCLHATQGFSASGLTFMAGGGSVRNDSATGLQFTSNVVWSSGAVAFFGSGSTILSGTSSSGNPAALQLGLPTGFAPTVGVQPEIYGSGHVLSQRGSVTLPTGKLSFHRGAVLELGNGNFSRALGTGTGQFEMPTSMGAGWAAWGADRTVNVGAGGQSLVWGQAAPAFLNEGGLVGPLLLGSATATHTLILQNGLELDNGAPGNVERRIVTRNGPAATEARLNGNISMSDPSKVATLRLDGEGTLEIAGSVSGRVALRQDQGGTTRFSGGIASSEAMTLDRGNWIFTSTATPGSLNQLKVGSEGTINASAMPATEALTVEHAQVDGIITGNLKVDEFITGHGTISGNLEPTPEATVAPAPGEPLKVGGNFRLASGSTFRVDFAGDNAANVSAGQLQVTGSVTLNGGCKLSVPAAPAWLLLGQRFYIIMNAGGDPVGGSFPGLSEGALLPIGGGKALKLTYVANGDGAMGGNDIALDVVPEAPPSNRTLAVSGPAVVAPGEEFVLTYTLGNTGPATVTGARFEGIVPAGAELRGSTPEGSLDQQTLSMPLANMPSGGSATVTLRFTAGSQSGALATSGTFTGNTADSDGADPVANRVVAILPGGADAKLALSGLSQSAGGDSLGLSLETLAGVKYRVESSVNLASWTTVEEFIGTGAVMTRPMPVDARKEFFRIVIVP